MDEAADETLAFRPKYDSQGLLTAIVVDAGDGAVLMVKARGSRPGFTSLQRSGIETVAPGTGRAENGAAIVLPYPF